MAITNYGELKTAIANFLARSDLTSMIPDFITLAQSRMYFGDEARNMPPLRVRAMVTRQDLSIIGSIVPAQAGDGDEGAGAPEYPRGATDVPTGLLSFERIHVDNTEMPQVSYIPPEDFWSWEAVSQTGTPTHYTIEGDFIIFQPAEAATLKTSYYAKLTALSLDTDTDWILTNAPHIYLQGALAEAYDYLLDDQRSEWHFSRFASAVRALHRSDEESRTSGAALNIRPRSVV